MENKCCSPGYYPSYSLEARVIELLETIVELLKEQNKTFGLLDGQTAPEGWKRD